MQEAALRPDQSEREMGGQIHVLPLYRSFRQVLSNPWRVECARVKREYPYVVSLVLRGKALHHLRPSDFARSYPTRDELWRWTAAAEALRMVLRPAAGRGMAR